MTTNDRCSTCGAKNETHTQDHLCRMHRAVPNAPCDICGSVVSDGRRELVCVFCGEGFGYEGQTPDEATLRAAVDHEKDCPKNPYKAKIERFERIIKEIHDTFYGQGFQVGDTVLVFDRYRFASRPLKAKILDLLTNNDSARIMLLESNNVRYPVGSEDVWVCIAQLRHVEGNAK